ncbi:MAG: hypothetical protein ACYDCN_17430, partial [Bacteroidia bacterium]
MRINKLIAFIFLFISVGVMGQQSLSRTKNFVLSNDTLTLDTLSLVPQSVKLYSKGVLLDTGLYKIIPEKKMLVFNRKLYNSKFKIQNSTLTDTLRATYQVFPLDFNKEAYHKDIKDVRQDLSFGRNPYTIKFNSDKEAQNFFASDGLTKNGSISRGISFGNNQDMVVNSALNLQISGKLTKDIEISMAATDNSIPVQPEGNSQSLQEFDNVFIQLKDKKSKLIVGNYQMQSPNSYFMKFYKRTQGLMFSNDYEIAKGAVLKTTVSGAIVGGTFARNVIMGIESNQGPYRLSGANNELYIVVLSGTERVFISGVQLKRGLDNDYVIDYNLGQITFTAKQLITKDKRIEVEFQYSVKSYSRAVYFINEEYQTKKFRLAVNYYDEQDNKNKPLQQTLSSRDRSILYGIGDTISKARSKGDSLYPFNGTDVFYRKIDTTVVIKKQISPLQFVYERVTFPKIFVYTTYPYRNDSAYHVAFSNVGANNGDYVQIQSPANGAVYQWVEPINGVKQGSFEPFIPLVAPTKKQMLTVISEYKTSETGLLGVEGVYTNYDVNTLSPLDKSKNNGEGAKVYYTDKKKLGVEDTTGKHQQWLLNYGGNYEFVQKSFTQVERFRSVEFSRDWNRINDTIFGNQHIANATAGISKRGLFSLQYNASSFIEQKLYTGIKQDLANTFNIGKTQGFYTGSYLFTNSTPSSETGPLKTNFYRHKSKVAHRVGKLVLGYQDEFENNKFRNTAKDSLLGKSYQFWDYETSISNADTAKNRYKVFYRERIDKFGYANYLKKSADARYVGI